MEAPKPDEQNRVQEANEQQAVERHGERVARHATRQCWSPQEAAAFAAWDE